MWARKEEYKVDFGVSPTDRLKRSCYRQRNKSCACKFSVPEYFEKITVNMNNTILNAMHKIFRGYLQFLLVIRAIVVYTRKQLSDLRSLEELF